MTSLVERLRNISRGDHERGCQGREYVCSCDYDETSWKTAEEAADEIERLRSDLSTGRRTALLEGRRQAFDEAGQKAREYAALYPEASDGRNTFIIFAEWAEVRP